MRLGIIGFGAIANQLCDILRQQIDDEYDSVTVLVREGKIEEISKTLSNTQKDFTKFFDVVSDIDSLIAASPDLVVECAGHSAVRAFVPKLLDANIDVIIASIGALCDDDLYHKIKTAAEKSNAQIVLPAGAIGGIDVLSAASNAEIQKVIYKGRKPALSWKGTPAENFVDLDTLTNAHVFFEGTAREAARSYPKNANVAATLALAGIGFDKTEVQLIADPSAIKNTHHYQVISDVVEYEMELVGKASPNNPKTSMTTVYSLAREVLNRNSRVVI